ncbi:TPA: hypothetical protein KUN31_000321 [Enterobacter cloacae]|nr:hypothetical protein [Enterobacter cloacae]
MVLDNFYNRKQIGILPIENVNFTYLSIALIVILLLFSFGIFKFLTKLEKTNVKNKNAALQKLANAEKAKYKFAGQQKFNKICYDDNILTKYMHLMDDIKKSIHDFISVANLNPSYVLFCEESIDKLNKEENFRSKLLNTLSQGEGISYSTELDQYRFAVIELHNVFSNVLTLSVDNTLPVSGQQTIDINDI